jgi:hypothetical protein
MAQGTRIPVLTAVVGRRQPGDIDAEGPAMAPDLDELRTRIASGSFALVETLLDDALKEMEATLRDEVVGRLRNELPGLIEQALREHFGDEPPGN